MFDPDEVEAEPVEKPEAPPGLGRGLPGVMADAWQRMNARARGEERCLPVPWQSLADLYNGKGSSPYVLRPGVHVLVGGTGSGKTQLALALALEAAHDGHPVAYVGLELDPVGLAARLAALKWAQKVRRRAGMSPADPVDSSERWSVIDWPRTPAGRAALERVQNEVEDELGKLDRFRVLFADARDGSSGDGFSADDLGAVCARVAEDSTLERPGLVVLDFLQLLGPRVEKDGRINPDDREIRTRIARAAYVASNATRDGRLAVLLVSATARENYRKLVFGEKAVYAGSLVGLGKESGEIEYSATSVLVIARQAGRRDFRFIGLAKNRHGGEGWISLGWNGSDYHEGVNLPTVADEGEATNEDADDGSPPKPRKRARAGGGDDRPRGAGDDL